MIGKHINNYEVMSLLGEGGMGAVYLALHPIMGRKAAIKVLKPELARDESLVMRFFNEARAANAIRHPNIIDIIDVGLLPDDNIPYMLMEFLEGESLATRLERSRQLKLEVAVEIASQTASALAAAHSKGIVHRDLKPDNLFLVPDEMVGGGERVKVLDFGIAKLRDDIRGSSMRTRTGAIMGTAAYMSPEQCQGLIERIDHRTDVYALGIILYEMLCGSPPFMSEGFGDIIIMHVMREPEAPQKRNPAVTEDVAAAMLKALAKDPAHRFQSMTEFLAALRGRGLSHVTPAPVATAILDAQPSGMNALRHSSPDRWGGSAGGGATSPTVSLPDADSAVATRGSTQKQTTTFRTSNGEISDTDMVSPRNRKTAIAIASVVGLAAAGLAVTLLVTRPSKGPVETPTAQPAIPAAALPEPEKPAPSPPPPPPVVAQPDPVPEKATEPTDEPSADPTDKPGRHRKTPKGSKPVQVSAPVAPSQPSPPPGGKNDIERW